jgi:dCMP deaminase
MKDNSELRWDSYFMSICDVVAKNSKCMSRKIGSILVKDRAIISTGYNGPVRGAKHCNERTLDFYNKLNEEPLNKTLSLHGRDENLLPMQCPRRIFGYPSGKGLFLCQAGHAERNTLIQAARNGISTLNTTLYCCCPLPCKECMIECINAGVKEIVCFKGNDYDSYSRIIAKEANIILRELEQNA